MPWSPGLVAGLCALLLVTSRFAQAETLKSVQKQPDGVTVSFGADALMLEALAPDVIRVRYSANGVFPTQRVPVLIARDSAPIFRVDRDDAAS